MMVITPKHNAADLMSISILLLKQFSCASVGEKKKNSESITYFLFFIVPTHALHYTLTLRRLMSYIYIYIYMEHPFLMFLDHTQRRSTVGRTPLDE